MFYLFIFVFVFINIVKRQSALTSKQSKLFCEWSRLQQLREGGLPIPQLKQNVKKQLVIKTQTVSDTRERLKKGVKT